MSRNDDTVAHEGFTQLAAGYAVDALEPDEERVFERHLSTCAECRTFVEDCREVTTAMARATSTPPPAGLRAAILDAVAAEQVPSPIRLLEAPHKDRVRAAPWLLTAAAALVVALLGWNLALRGQVHDSQVALSQAAQVLTCANATDCRAVWLSSPGHAAVGAVLIRHDSAQLVLDRVTPNDRNRQTYVLWQSLPSGAMRAVTTFDVPGDGLVVLPLPTLPAPTSGSTVFAVSREVGRHAPAVPSTPLLRSS